MQLDNYELFLLEYLGSLKGRPIDINDFPDHIKGRFPLDFFEDGNLNEILQGLKRQGYIHENGSNFWVINNSGNNILDEYLKEKDKERLQKEMNREKAAIELELAKRNLKDYKITKILARISFIVALGLAFFELYKWIKAS